MLDNLKDAVLKPDLYDPKFNRGYEELARHYNILMQVTLALVENAVRSEYHALLWDMNANDTGCMARQVDQFKGMATQIEIQALIEGDIREPYLVPFHKGQSLRICTLNSLYDFVRRPH